MTDRFDPRILELIPHRPPMLLVNRIVSVSIKASSALVYIDEDAPFFEPGKGVPAWVGLEYMGQTAALIAGHGLQQGLIEPHLGFLLGTRAYKSTCDYFAPGATLKVACTESVATDDGLAKFSCQITLADSHAAEEEWLATASLSVFRRPLDKKD
ncbi:ApeP family dehydratase [Alteromonas halophila]|uniref:3-hydroxydecanoyl-ACP dehydratase n=1 Tax=Alteromonas halophila TaxID=516698 RepID=A0A918JJU1_9ALTE|nr:3-hydroxylacyl-ACP dehydratase [Alteromonas halophila]GGW84938.1 3-hydroxydecanoyl-ACP dehydratase [Alteromonas halophila]